MSATAWLFVAGGAIVAGVGGYFVIARPALLPEDLRYLRRSDGEVEAAIPRLRKWLHLVFIVLGGHMVSTGILTIYVAVSALGDNNPSTVVVLALAGASSVGAMVVVNFQLHSAFRWVLLAALLPWVVAIGSAALSWLS
ncbi:hypothetical protein [Mycolicibacterium gilvum]|uniref:Transmembrane protein n=1 Tax=Mycolicibacterium gilvum TaxID=1804 RepID=A0A378SQG2_9MYCO|nr:hypothetical protein [Mycolicibacterium gilvum]MCV7055632.1 hypothetical protein [Mycolicibacterium gilvum]STZ44338.1 Uncharacterised protein [Mycolicibacterium gilvum]